MLEAQAHGQSRVPERLADYSTMLTLDLWHERTEIKDVIAHFPAKYRPFVRRVARKVVSVDSVGT